MYSPTLQSLTVLHVSPAGQSADSASLAEGEASLTVVPVASSDQALAVVDDGTVDAVVCDHDPPAVDAMAFVRDVRDSHRDVPVLVTSAPDDDEWVRRALAADATDVLDQSARSATPAVLANRLRHLVARAGDQRDGDGQSTSLATPADGGGDWDREGDGGVVRPVGAGRTSPEPVLAVLDDASDALRRVSGKADVADVVVDAAERVLDVPGVGVFLLEDERNYLRPAAVNDTLAAYYGDELVFGPGKPDSLTWRAFVTGESLVYEDVRTSGRHVNPDTEARAGMFVPLGEHGTFVVSGDAAEPLPDRSRRATKLLAGMAVTALDSVETATTLRERDRTIQSHRREQRRVERTNDMLRSVVDAVVDARGRADVEAAVCAALVETPWFDFAWIGDVRDGRIEPRHWTDGGSQYLDAVSHSLEDSDEPACLSARTREVTAVSNVAEHVDSDGWERAALTRGFHAVLSVPLVSEDILYGTLTLYADRPDAFEPVTDAVSHVADATAFAMDAAETRASYVSNSVTELELEIAAPTDALNDLARATGTTIDCVELSPRPDDTTEILFAAPDVSAESVLAATNGLVAVESVEHVGRDEVHRFRAVLAREMVATHLVRAGGIPEVITADGTSLAVTVYVPENVDARTFHDRVARQYPDTKLTARREHDRPASARAGFLDDLGAELTDRQLDVLQAAHELGFFASPREATGQDVADVLDVSQPTVSHHLREGQGRLFSLLFGER